MPDETNKAEIIKWLIRSLISIVVAFACFAYGQLSVRVDGLEIAVSQIKTENARMVETMRWLENMKNDYMKVNGKMNMGDFIEELLTKK